MHEFCVVIPAYMESRRVGNVIEGVRAYCEDVVVVDDGSTDGTDQAAEREGAVVLRHETNLGKGAALESGFRYARDRGFEAVVTMDADGQHDPQDLPAFFSTYGSGEFKVLVGNRMDRATGMPLLRRWTNRFMSGMLSRVMGQSVPDTQCGYRLYALAVLPGNDMDADRFAAESEILLWLSDRGVRIGSVPIRIIYGDEQSKIRPVRDTLRFVRMLRRYRTRAGSSQDLKRGARCSRRL